MPLPVAHSLAGLAVFKGLDADGTLVAWRRLLAAVVIANVADADLIPGILAGEPNRYHHVGFSHSATTAIVVALLVAAVMTAAGRRWPTRAESLSAVAGTALMVGLLLLSHVLLDSFNNDTRPPSGVPMWWPFAAESVQLYPWFVPVAKRGGEGTAAWQFVRSVLTPHNLYAAFWEFVTLAPLVALVAWQRKRRRPGRLPEPTP